MKSAVKTGVNPKMSALPTHPTWCWPLKLVWLPSLDKPASTPRETAPSSSVNGANGSEDVTLDVLGPDASLTLLASDADTKQRWLALLRATIHRLLDFGEDCTTLHMFF